MYSACISGLAVPAVPAWCLGCLAANQLKEQILRIQDRCSVLKLLFWPSFSALHMLEHSVNIGGTILCHKLLEACTKCLCVGQVRRG